MVQRPIPQGKPRRAAKESMDTVNKPRNSDPGDDCPGTTQVAHVPQSLQKWWRDNIADGFWLGRAASSGKFYVASGIDRQPKEVNADELDELLCKLREGSKLQISEVGPSSKKRRASSSSSPQTKRRILNTAKTPETDEDDDYVSDADDELDGVLDGEEGEEYHTQPVKICDLLEWYFTALKMMGQLACKDIGKIWIKACHPKKQTTNPYNGGATKEESLRRFGFGGAMTTPKWWPSCDGWEEGKGCRHQEPDHIKKPERLILLRHILRCGHPYFTIEKLEMATKQLEREIPKHFTSKSIKILKQIYYARRQEIRCEDHCIDPESTINLYVPKPPAKAPKVAKSIAAVAIKEEPSPRITNDRRQAKVSTKETDSEASIEEKQPIINQTESDSTDESERTLPRSTPSSATSNIGSKRLSTVSTQGLAQSMKGVTPKTTSPSITIQLQCSRQASTSATCLAATSHLGGPTTERTQEPARKRPSLAQVKTSSKSVPVSRGQRASVSNPTKTQSRSHQARYQPYNGFPGPSKHRHMTTTHNAHHLPKTLSNAPTYRHNPLQQTQSVSRPITFSGSSSGLSGLSSEIPWHAANNTSGMQHYGAVYTDGADPNAFLTPYPLDLTSSFGSEYSDNSSGGGLSMSSTMGCSQSQMQANQQAIDAEYRQEYPTWMTSNFDALSIQPGPSKYLFPADHQMGIGTNYYGQEYHQ